MLLRIGSFVAKGVSIGAVMALVIGSGGASLPEMILLKKMGHDNPNIFKIILKYRYESKKQVCKSFPVFQRRNLEK